MSTWATRNQLKPTCLQIRYFHCFQEKDKLRADLDLAYQQIDQVNGELIDVKTQNSDIQILLKSLAADETNASGPVDDVSDNIELSVKTASSVNGIALEVMEGRVRNNLMN